ncbi:MAG: GGDEF and EAL domain-containing protein [Deltaproteobacteria bacterium]|nr:GGDEF and EAL domain-containing protein [Deltaproteobacteria bacterium]
MPEDKNNKGQITLKSDENYIPTGLPGGFFIYNAQGNEEIYFAEQNVIELFGCKTIAEFRELTGNSFRGMVHPDDLEKVENDIQAQTFASEKIHDYVRYRILTKQGETRYVEDFGHLLHGKGGQKYFYVYIVDVGRDEYFNRDSNSVAETAILSEMQNLDRLTGLMNRRSFYEKVQNAIFATKAYENTEVFFIYFDIVHFKVFNEDYGFESGDAVLCQMAKTLLKEFPDAHVARFDGDHFVVCTASSNVVMHVENIRNLMAIIHGDVHLEVKAGIYKLEDSCDEVRTACDRARLACNTVKKRYDKIYGMYDSSLNERLRLQKHVVNTIDKAIENNYLRVYYQPIIRVKTGRICAYEALVRWIDPQKGFLPPGDFIITLEEFHLVQKVDIFVVKKVCEDLRGLLDSNEPVVPMSINLSRLDFKLCNIFEIIEQTCTHYNIPRNLLHIEITESAMNNDYLHLRQELEQFRDVGYHVWIDDFGSGYSSLNSLLSYNFDVLKLDMDFLRTYDEHPQAASLIHNIVQSARALGVKALQEGVETKEHLEFLKKIGCDYAQGFYFAKPMPLEESRRMTREIGLEWETEDFWKESVRKQENVAAAGPSEGANSAPSEKGQDVSPK